MARTSNLDAEIRSRIDAFLGDISRLVRQSALEAVRGALGDNGAAAPARGPGRPRGGGARSAPAAAAPRARKAGRRGKRTSEDVDALAAQLLDYVRANPGQGVEGIAKGMRVSTKELKLPVIKLLGSKSLRTEGQRRGTKYFAGGRGGGGGGGSANGRKAKGSARKNARGGRKGARKKGGRRAAAASAQTSAAAA